MWLSAIKLAVSAGSKIYANKQKTKMAMSSTTHARYKNGPRPGSLPRQIIRSKAIGLEGRGGPRNIKFARVGARVGGDIG
jgi:hypothetical protein